MSRPHKLIQTLIKIEAHEVTASFTSFFLIFTLMASYYILRPVRDAMASDWTDAELSWLWTSTFALSVVAVALYGIAIAKIKLKHLIPGVYAFFAFSFLGFYLGTQTSENPVYIDKAFYVWLSVFSLFHISVFWSVMADTFSKEQSKRLFGFIASGAGIGAIAGPSVTIFLSASMGTYNLMLLASLLLVFIIPMLKVIERLKRTALKNASPEMGPLDQKSIGGNPFIGFSDFISHRYLLGIGFFILLYTAMSTFVYFELKNMMADLDRATRSQYWGIMDLMVNSLAIITALFATGRLATRFGLAITLSIIPVLMVIGWLALALSPALPALMGLQIVRRAGNYAITRPAREMLFTLVSRETRFKTKSVIDIIVYRGGDMLTGWAYTGLAQGLGIGLTGIALIGALIAIFWAMVAVFIGNAYDQSSSKHMIQ